MQQVFFSIITVTYNAETTIRKTLESVKNQTYQNYEYIIIDGKSTDCTMDIILEYKEIMGDKMIVVSEPDGGIYDAMNKGIKLAKGQIVGIINSDDWYEINTLENIVLNYSEHRFTVYHGYMRTIDQKNGKEIRCAIYNPEYIREAMINHPTTFVCREIYEKYGMFDCKYKMSADYDFIIRLTKEKDIKFIPIYEVLANFRTGGISNSVKALMETMRIKKHYKMMTNVQYYAAMVYLYVRKIFNYHTL